MTHVSEIYPRANNRYRVAGPFVEHNFGLIEVDWNAAPEPLVHLKALGVDGAVGLHYQVELGELR